MLKPIPTLAALALALAFSGPALAQLDSSNDIEALSAILGAGKTAAQVRSLREVPSVGVITIGDARVSPSTQIGDEAFRLKIYAERNAAGVNSLRHALGANPVTRQALAAHGVSIGDVLGVQVGSSGSLRIFEK